MTPGSAARPLDVLVIGGGQAGLAMGYHLAQRGLSFQVVDAGTEIGTDLAVTVGFAAAVHLGPLRQPAGPAVPCCARHLPRQGRRRGLPAGLRGNVRSAGPAQRVGDIARQKRQRLRRARGRRRAGGQAGGGRHRALPGAARPADRRRARPQRAPGAQRPLPAPADDPAGNGTGRRRSELRMPDRQGTLGDPPVELSAGQRIPTIPQRPLGRDVWTWATALRLDKVTADSRLGKRLAGRDQVIGSGPRQLARHHGVLSRPRAFSATGRTVTFADGSAAEYDAVVWATGFAVDHSWIDIPEVERRPGTRPAPAGRGALTGPLPARRHLAAHPRLRAARLGRE